LVHGLGGSPETWNNFRYKYTEGCVRFINDIRYSVRRAVRMEPSSSFLYNAMRLLDEKENKSSFASLIWELRKMGYAANQVEYVCHSMGGCVLRTAVENQAYKPTGGARLNYQKGYVNRAITLDTPHNGSELANLLVDLENEISNLSIITYFANTKGSDFYTYNNGGKSVKVTVTVHPLFFEKIKPSLATIAPYD